MSLTVSPIPISIDGPIGANDRIRGGDYDPVENNIYWAEVEDDKVKCAKLDDNGNPSNQLTIDSTSTSMYDFLLLIL